jgi:L-serine dehydratase
MLVSIFNDVIGPVMRGPSSSHCAAALRIGRLALDLMGGEIDRVDISYDTGGSLPMTHASQGSDMGLFGGLMGWEATDARLPSSMAIIQNDANVEVTITYADLADEHPNTYRLKLTNAHGSHSLMAISTGGGMIEVIKIDGHAVSLFGDTYVTLIHATADTAEHISKLTALGGVIDVSIHGESGSHDVLVAVTSEQALADDVIGTTGIKSTHHLRPVLPVQTTVTSNIPFSTAAGLLDTLGPDGTLLDAALSYEAARSGLTAAELRAKMVDIVTVLKGSIASGLAGTEYADRVLGYQSGGFRDALAAGKLLPAGALNVGIMYVTALMEVKSSMGVIVAMPTAGACAALPGIVIALAEELGYGDEAIADAFLAAGLIGVFITTAWSFAAEVGGCQAEGGSAAAMAAAALVTLTGGTTGQALAAASMALQSMLGLICDPIANRVEAPCLGKNVMAAANAISCANMAISGFDQVIPFDEVIETAKRVSAQMPRELRCTALGGLSISPTSKAIELRLASVSANGGCGTGGCGSCGCG